MGGFFLNFRTWWETADRTQRAVTLFGGAFLVLLLGGTFYFASKPRFEMVAGGMSAAEQAAATTELQQMGMETQTGMDGSLLVPSNKLAEATQRLAATGKLPAAGHLGIDSLDKMGALTSPRVEKERLKAVLEGQVASALEKIDGVAGAEVALTLGDDSPFAADRQPATASVTLVEQGGGVGFDQAKSMARIVANSVPGLDTKNVSIINQSGQALWDGSEQSGTGGRAAQKIDAEIAESRRRERELQSMLDSAFGPGNTVAKVTLELDFDKNDVTKSEVLPTDTLLSDESFKETMKGGGTAVGAGAPAGADGALGSPAAAGPIGSAAGQSYEGKKEGKMWGHTQTDTRTEKSAGNLLGMGLTVLVDQEKVKDPAPIENVLKGYLGSRDGTPGFTRTVQAVAKFDRTAAAAAVKSAAASASGAKMQQYFSLLPIVGLVLMSFIVIKAIGKTAKSGNVLIGALPGGGTMALNASGGSHRATQEAGSDGRPALTYTTTAEEAAEIEKISTKINRPLEAIKKMTDERPEVVAMLIKGWLLEERI